MSLRGRRMSDNSNVSTASGTRARRLRVLHLAYTFYENDNRVLRYAEALGARGDDVEVIALRRDRQPRWGHAAGVQVHRIQRRAVTEKKSRDYLLKLLWFLVQDAVFLSIRAVAPIRCRPCAQRPDFLVSRPGCRD